MIKFTHRYDWLKLNHISKAKQNVIINMMYNIGKYDIKFVTLTNQIWLFGTKTEAHQRRNGHDRNTQTDTHFQIKWQWIRFHHMKEDEDKPMYVFVCVSSTIYINIFFVSVLLL